MHSSTLFGSSVEEGDKKLCRVTVSLSIEDMSQITNISIEKNISYSEVVNRLIQPALKKIKNQEELIKQTPSAVAFDLITTGGIE